MGEKSQSATVVPPREYRIDAEGFLVDVRRCLSPNQDLRPQEAAISLLVVHAISLPEGEFGGPYIDRLFTNCLEEGDPCFAELTEQRVSAHLLIRRDGALTQYVAFPRRAWHAGVSQFDGRDNCNDFSIGIELEGCDTQAYTAAQYRLLATLGRLLMAHYPAITPARILGHCDIAPGRKTDPGPSFDWARFRRLL